MEIISVVGGDNREELRLRLLLFPVTITIIETGTESNFDMTTTAMMRVWRRERESGWDGCNAWVGVVGK